VADPDARALPRPAGSGAIPSLDGVRAIAVSLVFLAHSGAERYVPGGLGVTIFFVLSGYLITTLLRVENDRSGTISLRSFYLRRLIRLMPPLLAVVAGVGLLVSLSIVAGDFAPGGLVATLFYFGNYYVIAHDFNGLPAGLGVVWSLAVEEHFYIFFPLLALLLLRIDRVRISVWALATLCAAILAWRFWLAGHGVSADYLAMATDTRVDAILVGCLMAMARNPHLESLPAAPVRAHWAIALLCCFALVASLLYRDDFFRSTARYTVQSLAIAPLIYLAVARHDHWAFRWLSARPLVYLGSVSYTIYLVHHVILLAVARGWPRAPWGITALCGALVTLAVAEPVRRLIDQPCAELRRRLHRRVLRRGVAPALATAGTP
jgi:peptidoglycan/LPS O-acetylase OafA/YrhL